jgi:DNA-binding CsgD family transcriptional regulator
MTSRRDACLALSLLERAGYGAAICTGAGVILARNELAPGILAMLAPPHAANGGEEPAQLPPVLVSALQGGDAEPLFLHVDRQRCIGIRTFAGSKGTDAKFLLLLVDLSHRPPPAIEVLQRAFGLTRREARVASALATGMRLQDVAAMHGVGTGTVRSHLKSIFIKTGTNRQPELVALLARLVPFS